jgi:hypothetical protein
MGRLLKMDRAGEWMVDWRMGGWMDMWKERWMDRRLG